MELVVAIADSSTLGGFCYTVSQSAASKLLLKPETEHSSVPWECFGESKEAMFAVS